MSYRIGNIFLRRLNFRWRCNFFRTSQGWHLELPVVSVECHRNWRALCRPMGKGDRE